MRHILRQGAIQVKAFDSRETAESFVEKSLKGGGLLKSKRFTLFCPSTMQLDAIKEIEPNEDGESFVEYVTLVDPVISQ